MSGFPSIIADKNSGKAPTSHPGVSAVPLLFYTVFFLALLIFINPALLFSSNGLNLHAYVSILHATGTPLYDDLLYRNLFTLELTPAFLSDILSTPGGLTRLAVTLGIYACRYRVAGALIITLLAAAVHGIFTLYVNGLTPRKTRYAGYFPSFFILVACAWYELRFASFLLPVAGALTFAVVCQRLHPAGTVKSILLHTVFFWSAWYATHWGGLLFLLFIVLTGAFNRKKQIIPAVAAATVNSILFFLVENRLLPLTMTVRWTEFTLFSGLPLVMILFFPIAAGSIAGLNRVLPESRLTGNKSATALAPLVLFSCCSVAVAAWTVLSPVNRDTRLVARMMDHVVNRNWNAVLHENTTHGFSGFPQKAGPLQVLIMQMTNHALCETGQMGSSFFSRPQAVFDYDPLLMLQSMSVHGYANWLMAVDLAMDLGMINTAEKIAGELMENMGPYPDIIYRRALVHLAQDNPAAAAVYLRRLTRMPYYRVKAQRLLREMNGDGTFPSEPRIAAMRAYRDTVDYFIDKNLNCGYLFENLVQSNPRNKAAYDYLMSACLLYDRLDRLAELIPMAPSLGYRELPRSWEEGLCLYLSSDPQRMASIDQYGLRQETVQRFFEFTRAWSAVKDDPAAAAKLAPVFGSSYFFFSMFRYSPGAVHE